MAAIDKTYISSFEDYKKVVEWAKDKSFKLKNGQVIKPYYYIYYPDITKEEWDKWEKEYLEKNPNSHFWMVLWNTPTYLDIWLIKNCPFDFIQERLKEQYDYDNFYDLIKIGKSPYDTFERPKSSKKISIRKPYSRRNKNIWWRVEVENDTYDFWYNSKDNQWYCEEEAMPITSNVCSSIHGPLTKKNVYNIVKNWNLPVGTKVIFQGVMKRYLVAFYEATIK